MLPALGGLEARELGPLQVPGPRLERAVGRRERDEQEEGLVPMVLHEPDRCIPQAIGEIALLRRRNAVLLDHAQVRGLVVGVVGARPLQAAVEPVPADAVGVVLLAVAEVPLPHVAGGQTRSPHAVGEGAAGGCDAARLAPDGEVHLVAELLLVAARQQPRARRRADARAGVEVRENEPLRCQPVEGGREALDVGLGEGLETEVAVARVVREEDDHVRETLLGFGGGVGRGALRDAAGREDEEECLGLSSHGGSGRG